MRLLQLTDIKSAELNFMFKQIKDKTLLISALSLSSPIVNSLGSTLNKDG